MNKIVKPVQPALAIVYIIGFMLITELEFKSIAMKETMLVCVLCCVGLLEEKVFNK